MADARRAARASARARGAGRRRSSRSCSRRAARRARARRGPGRRCAARRRRSAAPPRAPPASTTGFARGVHGPSAAWPSALSALAASSGSGCEADSAGSLTTTAGRTFVDALGRARRLPVHAGHLGARERRRDRHRARRAAARRPRAPSRRRPRGRRRAPRSGPRRSCRAARRRARRRARAATSMTVAGRLDDRGRAAAGALAWSAGRSPGPPSTPTASAAVPRPKRIVRSPSCQVKLRWFTPGRISRLRPPQPRGQERLGDPHEAAVARPRPRRARAPRSRAGRSRRPGGCAGRGSRPTAGARARAPARPAAAAGTPEARSHSSEKWACSERSTLASAVATRSASQRSSGGVSCQAK